MNLRAARSPDHSTITAVVAAAFGRAEEADIVTGVRAEGAVVAEMVAEADGEVVGHILFSRMAVTPDRFVAALGPLAVAPAWQNAGVGSALTHAGIAALRDVGAQAVIVLGHPTYYPRFGFSHEAAGRLASPFTGRPAFMALALTPGALDEPLAVAYSAAFGTSAPR